MRILLEALNVKNALQSFLAQLTSGCSPVTARVRWRGTCQEREVFVNARFQFWFFHKRTANRHWFQFGVMEPSWSGELEPACEMNFPFSGFDRRMNSFFVKFGKDVLVAHSGRIRGEGGTAFLQFSKLHEYDLTTHGVAAPGGMQDAFILSSVSSPALAYTVSRFVSAVNDYRQWAAHGLLVGARDKAVFSPKSSGDELDISQNKTAPGWLHTLVAQSVRDQLAKFIKANKLRYRVGSSPASDIILALPDDTLLAAFQVKTGLSPDELYTGIGQLLLPRSTFRAAKFLVIPGTLGPFFTQALFRHDIHVTPYKLTQDMAVVLDAQAVFAAIQAVE